jgi:meiotically up-regulated gene 157 (Mug157) protein
MWLRDSTNQVWPYLRFARQDPALARLLAGVVNRQAACVLLDPYANAFNAGPTGGHWQTDHTAMKPELHERKYELDSLCAVLRLACGYHRATGDRAPFDARWLAACDLIVATMRAQQAGSDEDEPPAYSFRRTTPAATDTLALDGRGHPARRCGLVKSHFRPSDDAATMPFPIAANAMAVACLRDAAALLTTLGETARAASMRALAQEIDGAIHAHGTVMHPRAGRILAYEVDGFGSAYCIDDANVPSLLALPYLGWCDGAAPLYRATRAFVLSRDNPYFFRGRAGEGVGGPHVGLGMIWPMAVVMRALTSDDDGEILACLRQLRDTTAGTGFLHETFHQDDATRFTRPWFPRANTLFGEQVLELDRARPALLRAA